MRDNYAQELHVQKDESHSGAGSARRRIYVHFRLLNFLKPVIELRQTESNLDLAEYMEPQNNLERPENDEQGEAGTAAPDSASVVSGSVIDEESSIVESPRSPSLQATRQAPMGASSSTTSLYTSTPRPPRRAAAQKRARTSLQQLHDQGAYLSHTLNNLMEENQDKRWTHYVFGVAIAQMMEDVPRHRVNALKAKISNIVSEFTADSPTPAMTQQQNVEAPYQPSHTHMQQYWGYSRAPAVQYPSIWGQTSGPQTHGGLGHGHAPPPSHAPEEHVYPPQNREEHASQTFFSFVD